MAAVSHRVFRGGAAIAIAGGLGAIGLALWMVGLALDPRHALFAYLTAWSFAAFLAVGALVFLAAGHAMNATWVVAVRRLAEAVVAIMPVLLVGAVPVLIGADELYPWVNPPASLTAHELHQLHHKQPWLDLPLFAARAATYFVVWIGAAWVLRAWSLRPRERNGRERAFSSAALPLIGIAVTFAAFDWLMSLEPLWLSTMFGLYVFAGGFLAALALITLLAWLARRRALRDDLTEQHFYAMGRLLLAFVVFWAYCGYFQAMLIRIADLPAEVTYFLRRVEGGWLVVSYVLILGHFAAPLAVLLIRRWKLVPGAMAAVSGWLLVMCYVDAYWLVMPAMDGHGAAPDWLELCALVGVSGACVAFAAWRQRGRPLLAEGDPRLDRALAYRGPQ